jgi:hypothetical protein
VPPLPRTTDPHSSPAAAAPARSPDWQRSRCRTANLRAPALAARAQCAFARVDRLRPAPAAERAFAARPPFADRPRVLRPAGAPEDPKVRCAYGAAMIRVGKTPRPSQVRLPAPSAASVAPKPHLRSTPPQPRVPRRSRMSATQARRSSSSDRRRHRESPRAPRATGTALPRLLPPRSSSRHFKAKRPGEARRSRIPGGTPRARRSCPRRGLRRAGMRSARPGP